MEFPRPVKEIWQPLVEYKRVAITDQYFYEDLEFARILESADTSKNTEVFFWDDIFGAS